jgi:Na+:H+ antiporter, NhaA family
MNKDLKIPTTNLKLTRLFNEFINSEKAGGLVLVFVTLLSLGLANSPWSSVYNTIWYFEFGGHTIVHWINDGLMTIFFLLIGLELEREIYSGELSNVRNALLPVFGALGGMIIPAVIYMSFNLGTDTSRGAGIPMATDIAFAIGILSLLGNKVPPSLKIFLTALAVIDDLGAIIIIAIFYTTSLAITNLCLGLAVFLILIIFNRLKVKSLVVYLTGGILMWYFMLYSGIHATITGVLLAFVIPFSENGKKSPSSTLQHFLHKPVAFIILPLFALANTCIILDHNSLEGLSHATSLGIILGLVIGKPVGICLFSFIAVGIGFCTLPSDLKWKTIFGAGILGGIGFTMSIFITMLAFNNPDSINNSKIAILIASLVAGVAGLITLWFTLKKEHATG